MARAKKTKKITEQEEIPGTERKTVPEVVKAGRAYLASMMERVTWLEDEKEKKAKLIEVMAKHGLTEYEDHKANLRIEYDPGEPKPKVKVRELDGGEEE